MCQKVTYFLKSYLSPGWLFRLWGPRLGSDKLAALLSRLVVAVAEVQPETDISIFCPSLS